MSSVKNILSSRLSDKKEVRRGGQTRRRDDYRNEQVVTLPFPVPLVKTGNGAQNRTIWPLNKRKCQPFFTGKINQLECCVDIYCPASVQCLYLMGYFGKGSLSRNAPVYKLHKKSNETLDNVNHNRRFSDVHTSRGNGRGQRGRGNRGRGGQQSSSSRGARSRNHGNYNSRQSVNHENANTKNLKQWMSLKSSFPNTSMNSEALINKLYAVSANVDQPADLNMSSNSDEIKATEIPCILESSILSSSDVGFSSEFDSDATSTASQSDSSVRKQEILKLGLEEAFFLSYGLGILTVLSADDDNTKLDLAAMWTTFSSLHNPEQLEQFAILYAAYHYFRSRGWIVKSGLKFGCELMLYKEGPPFYHALFSVTVVKTIPGQTSIDPQLVVEPRLSWPYLIGYHRLSRGVLKQPVICYVNIPLLVSAEDYKKPTVIEKMNVQLVLLERWQPGSERDRSRKGGNEGEDDSN
ncbi:tRNA-splicing endonuclease subunit Sen2 [Halotydeus destructor]|nr:tRNA-splicing endonuclease subunit Sen2 [Halotydeus destructor]